MSTANYPMVSPPVTGNRFSIATHLTAYSMISNRIISVWLFAGLFFLSVLRVNAQSRPLRIGVGFNTLLSPDDGLGIGFKARVSSPVNSDLSFAFDGGVSAFILQGRSSAVYVFDPQFSAIVNFANAGRATYLLGGFGGYIPFGSNGRSEGGPTIHLGLGWAVPLRETTLFYEVDPMLVIRKDDVLFVLPFRIGVIF